MIPQGAKRLQSRSYDKELYKARHLIENFFAKLKQFRAIATRYDKIAKNFFVAIHLACTYIWLVDDTRPRHCQVRAKLHSKAADGEIRKTMRVEARLASPLIS